MEERSTGNSRSGQKSREIQLVILESKRSGSGVNLRRGGGIFVERKLPEENAPPLQPIEEYEFYQDQIRDAQEHNSEYNDNYIDGDTDHSGALNINGIELKPRASAANSAA